MTENPLRKPANTLELAPLGSWFLGFSSLFPGAVQRVIKVYTGAKTPYECNEQAQTVYRQARESGTHESKNRTCSDVLANVTKWFVSLHVTTNMCYFGWSHFPSITYLKKPN